MSEHPDIKAILPARTVDSAPFWDGCQNRQLLLRDCHSCGARSYYPRAHCPHCGSTDVGWSAASGRATVWSFSHVAISFYGDEWASQLPYTPVLIDLAEGPRMLSRLIGPGRAGVRIGDAVKLVFVEVDGQQLPYFQHLS
jgi:uncharacterized OB-fold protein